MKTAVARDPQADRYESEELPTVGLHLVDRRRQEWDARSVDATQGRQIGSDPYDDATQGRKMGSDRYDDATQAR